MADPAAIIARIRSHGANVMLDGGKLVIKHKDKLPTGALDYVKAHGRAIAAFIENEADFEERAAFQEYDGGKARKEAEYFTRALMKRPPADVSIEDWQFFLGKLGQQLEGDFARRAA